MPTALEDNRMQPRHAMTAWPTEAALLAALRDRDEAAFRHLVALHQASLLRMARVYVPAAVVDEVVQETWLGVIRGLDNFEGRSSLRTWIFRILLNQARKRGPRERRTIPFASSRKHVGDGGPIVDPERLVHPDLGANYWPDAPPRWHEDPEGRLLGAETRRVVMAAIETLPGAQREVITLRDVESWTAEEVCEALRISAANQRVLLHRARTAVRTAIEEHVHG